MPIVRGTFPKALKADVHHWFDFVMGKQDYNWKRIYRTIGTEAAFEQVAQFSGFGLMVEKDEMGSVFFDQAVQGFTENFSIVDWALGFKISQNAINDDKSNRLLRMLTEALARSCEQTFQVNAYEPINLAFDTSKTYGDGKVLCATDHPMPGTGGGTWGNRPAADIDFCEKAIEDALIDQMQWQDGNGIRENVRPKMLGVGVENHFEAHRVFESKLRAYTANNDANALKDMNAIPQGWFSTPFITDTDSWAIFNDVDNGFTYWDREKLTFGEDTHFETFVHKFISFFRGTHGCQSPKAIYACPGVSE